MSWLLTIASFACRFYQLAKGFMGWQGRLEAKHQAHEEADAQPIDAQQESDYWKS